MTKVLYDAERFDQMALRLFDLACDLRALGHVLRDEQIGEFQLHDRKPQEWLGKLEAWTADARRRVKDERLRQLGGRRARQFLEKVRGGGDQ